MKTKLTQSDAIVLDVMAETDHEWWTYRQVFLKTPWYKRLLLDIRPKLRHLEARGCLESKQSKQSKKQRLYRLVTLLTD